MGKIPCKIAKVSLAAGLGLGAASVIYLVFVKTNAIHNTRPGLFVGLATTITAIVGVLIAWLMKMRGSERMRNYLFLAGSLFLGYAGLAWQMLNAGYFFALIMPAELCLQALIAWICIPTTLLRRILGPVIMSIMFIFGGYVSMHHEMFGIRNEHYWTFLIFLYPHLSIFVSLIGLKVGKSSAHLEQQDIAS